MFIFDKETETKIKEIATDGLKLDCAVAFWGEGAEALIPKNVEVRIICDLMSGCTNPQVIKNLLEIHKKSVKHLDNLHAKVYVGKNAAIVTSANASYNGLGLEGSDTGTFEAGFVVTDATELKKIKDWFEGHYNSAVEINDELMEEAIQKWCNRTAYFNNKNYETEIVDFVDYDFKGKNFPYVTGLSDPPDYDFNEASLKLQQSKAVLFNPIAINIKSFKKIIKHCEDFFEFDEALFLNPSQWILHFELNGDSSPHKTKLLNWAQVATYFFNTHRYDKDERDSHSILSTENVNGPFQVKDKDFTKSFKKLVSNKKYDILCGVGGDLTYDAKNTALMRDFWLELQDIIRKNQNAKQI